MLMLRSKKEKICYDIHHQLRLEDFDGEKFYRKKRIIRNTWF